MGSSIPSAKSSLQGRKGPLSGVLSVQIPGKDAGWPGLGHGSVIVDRDPKDRVKAFCNWQVPGGAGRGLGSKGMGILGQ